MVALVAPKEGSNRSKKRSQVVLVGYRGFQVGVGGLRWSKPRTPRCSQVAQLGLRLNGWLGLVPPKEGSSW